MMLKPLSRATHVFFDLDGTLTDPKEGIVECIRHALRQLKLPIPEEARLVECIGPPLQQTFRELAGDTQWESAITLYRERFKRVGMFENQVYPGIIDGLAQLKQSGRELYIVTSKPRVFATEIARHFGLHKYFTHVHGPDLNGHRSDKTELISYVLETERVPPTAALMVGDRRHDITGACNNGVTAAGVLWGYGSRQELNQAGALAVFDDVPSLFGAQLNG